MAKLYYDRYSNVLDWSNAQGRTALHITALKGDEELVRVSRQMSSLSLCARPYKADMDQMLCDLGADYDLADNEGNTPLH